MHLLLIRHGQSENNANAAKSVEAYRQGRKPDPELTELGRHQAEALGTWIGSVSPRPTKLYSSPMMRTIQTAAPVAEALDMPITVSDLIFERPGPVEIVDGVETGHPGSPLSALSAITDRAVFHRFSGGAEIEPAVSERDQDLLPLSDGARLDQGG